MCTGRNKEQWNLAVLQLTCYKGLIHYKLSICQSIALLEGYPFYLFKLPSHTKQSCHKVLGELLEPEFQVLAEVIPSNTTPSA